MSKLQIFKTLKIRCISKKIMYIYSDIAKRHYSVQTRGMTFVIDRLYIKVGYLDCHVNLNIANNGKVFLNSFLGSKTNSEDIYSFYNYYRNHGVPYHTVKIKRNR